MIASRLRHLVGPSIPSTGNPPRRSSGIHRFLHGSGPQVPIAPYVVKPPISIDKGNLVPHESDSNSSSTQKKLQKILVASNDRKEIRSIEEMLDPVASVDAVDKSHVAKRLLRRSNIAGLVIGRSAPFHLDQDLLSAIKHMSTDSCDVRVFLLPSDSALVEDLPGSPSAEPNLKNIIAQDYRTKYGVPTVVQLYPLSGVSFEGTDAAMDDFAPVYDEHQKLHFKRMRGILTGQGDPGRVFVDLGGGTGEPMFRMIEDVVITGLEDGSISWNDTRYFIIVDANSKMKKLANDNFDQFLRKHRHHFDNVIKYSFVESDISQLDPSVIHSKLSELGLRTRGSPSMFVNLSYVKNWVSDLDALARVAVGLSGPSGKIRLIEEIPQVVTLGEHIPVDVAYKIIANIQPKPFDDYIKRFTQAAPMLVRRSFSESNIDPFHNMAMLTFY